MIQTDRIEKKTTLRAPRSRVWRAISDSKEFGSWFGIKAGAPFTPGATVQCVITPTTVDAEVAKSQEPYAGMEFDIVIDAVEPERVFSFKWSPGPAAKGEDRSHEPLTLVVFTLEDAPEGTAVAITESGFDALPLERRAKAFAGNDAGWQAQTTLIKKYVERAP